MSIKVTFDLPTGKRLECVAEEGQPLLKLAQDNGIDLEGACGSSLACATCHVIFDSDWYDKLPEASTDEMDMLDLATGQTRTSRLSCQIKLTKDLDGLRVKIPD
jgi:2Fe-2S ferredoxin